MRYTRGMEFQQYMEMLSGQFTKEEEYVIWGAGRIKCQILMEHISNIKYIVDNDREKWGTRIGEYIVAEPERLKKEKNIKIIVAVHAYMDVFRQLKEYGIEENHYCYYRDFLVITTFMEKKEIHIPEITFLLLNRCNLRCKNCLFRMPYAKKQFDFSIDENKKAIDYVVKYVTKCDKVTLSGGEPFLYKDLGGG